MDCLDEGRELETLSFLLSMMLNLYFFLKKKAHLKYDKEAK
jgi:hypothetical protein